MKLETACVLLLREVFTPGSRQVEREVALSPRWIPISLDIAWAAGIYEGEGTCMNPSRISVTQKDPWLLHRLQALFGGRVSTQGVGKFAWNVSGKRARGFVDKIVPFLSPRRKEQLRVKGFKW